VWGSFARGRRPEVLNGAGPAAPSGAVSFTTLPAEIVDSVEAGAKGRFLGGRLGLEGSIFYYEYQDFQTTEFVGPRIVTINAGEATSTGFEGAVDYRPVDMLQLFANYAYNDAQLETGARKGNRFRLSPEHSFALGGTLSVALPAELKLVFTPTYTWQSEIFFDDDNDKPNLQNQRLSPFFNDTRLDEKQDSYGLINLRLNVVGPEERWSAGLYVTNLADEEYIIDAGNTGDSFGIPTFIRGTPRLVGLEVKGRF
jgi:outer membrane receptor protein involved in Fe transport